MNSNNYEMATSINALQINDTNVNNLVKNVENNIETLNTNNVPSSATQTTINQPPKYNPIVPISVPVQQNQYNQPEKVVYLEDPRRVVKGVYIEEKESLSKYIMSNVKEYLMITLLFSLLATFL